MKNAVILASVVLAGILTLLPSRAFAVEPRSAFAAGSGVSLATQNEKSAHDHGDASDDEANAEIAPDSPRASIGRFMDQCHAGQWDTAAGYLDLTRPAEAKRGRVLAEELCAVLNRKLAPDSDDLSPLASGHKIDGLPAGTDEIGRIPTASGTRAPIRIIRREAKDGEDARWVFSQSTVAHIDDWYETLGDQFMRRLLPPALLREGPHGFLAWQLLAAPIAAVLAIYLGRALARIVVAVLSTIARKERTRATLTDSRRALALLFAMIVLRVALPWGGLYLSANDLALRILSAGAALSIAWLMIVGSRTFAGMLRGRADDRPGRVALISLGERVTRLALIVIGGMFALSELGYQVSTLVTGLGIGGIAVALAAQKTLENLFGSIAILADQPFRIGELIRFDGTEGTVESIGLRSTRVRTLDRTTVVIPNGKLADMKVESYGTRDRYRLQVKIELRASNDPAKIESFLAELREKLAARDAVLPDDLFVNGQRLTLGVLEVELAGYVRSETLAAFYAERESVVLMALALAKTHGLALAERVETRVQATS